MLSPVQKEVLWIYSPQLTKNGMIESIKSVPGRYDINTAFWTQDPYCSGPIISDKACPLRIKEMELVSWTPRQCIKNKSWDCQELQVFVRYNVRQQVISEALDSFCTTIFTCVIMCIGSIMFSADTDRIVILPITKMVGIIRMLADDPL